jgi:hypothetical protein
LLKKLFNIKIAIKCPNPIIEDLRTKILGELGVDLNKITEEEVDKII